MERSDFEELVSEAIDSIPEKFSKLLENIAIVIEDEPDVEQAKKLKLGRGYLLFGLYEGVPQTKRGPHYGMTLPDKITIFQKQIEQAAGSPEAIKQIVRETIWHEIAHHFGSDEKRVREAEKQRKGR